MPLLKLETTVILNDEKRKSLMAGLSRAVAETIGKPEEYVMVTVNSLAISSNRIYLNFTEVEAGNWGWNGNTFD